MCKAGGYDGVALVPAAEDDPQHLAAVVLVDELHPLVQARAVVLLQDVGAVDRPVPPAERRQEVVRVPSGQDKRYEFWIICGRSLRQCQSKDPRTSVCLCIHPLRAHMLRAVSPFITS